MKKKIDLCKMAILCLLTAMLVLSFSACGNDTANTFSSERYNSLLSNQLAKYAKADFKKYNAYETDFDLGKTHVDNIFVEGEISKFLDAKDEDGFVVGAVLLDEDKNEWFVQLDNEKWIQYSDIENYDDFENKNVIIFGVHMGYSKRYSRPTIFATCIFDKETENSFITGWGKSNEHSPEMIQNLKSVVTPRPTYTPTPTPTNTPMPTPTPTPTPTNTPTPEPPQIVTMDDIKTGLYDEKAVILKDCVVDDFNSQDFILWVKDANGEYTSYIDVYQYQIPDYYPENLKNGDIVDIHGIAGIYYRKRQNKITIENISGYFSTDTITQIDVTEHVDINNIYNSYAKQCEPLDYEAVMRSPDKYYNTYCYFSGQIAYVEEDSSTSGTYVIRTDSGPVTVFYTRRPEPRFIKGDNITVYGRLGSGLVDTYLQIDKVPYVSPAEVIILH